MASRRCQRDIELFQGMIAGVVATGCPPDDPVMRLMAEQLELRVSHRDEPTTAPVLTMGRRRRIAGLIAQAEEAIAAGDPESDVLRVWVDAMRADLAG